MKEYKISEDIALLKDKVNAALKMVNIAMKLPFGYRKALRAATDSEKFENLFWKRVRKIYPIFYGKAVAYDSERHTVSEYIPDNKIKG